MMRKIVVALACVFVVMALLLGSSWYFSSQLLDVRHTSADDNSTILCRTGKLLTLTPSGSLSPSGRFGLEWTGGTGAVGPVLRQAACPTTDKSGQIRRLLAGGAGQLSPESKVRLTISYYSSPKAAGIHAATVRIPTPLGPDPAWKVSGRGRTWVIEVHGLGSNRQEPLRSMPALRRLGLPILDISYRNDKEAPDSPDHLYHLGATEWQDLDAALTFARKRGARRFVLYGYSMGGGIIESFIRHSSQARLVKAVVLDSPALDWYQILELAAEQRNLPGAFAAVVERVVAWRIGLWSLDPVDFLTGSMPYRPPTLLFQGTDDTLVPPRSNIQFAHSQRNVQLVLTKGAGHTQSWNVNPRRYDRKLESFLRRRLDCRNFGLRTTCN